MVWRFYETAFLLSAFASFKAWPFWGIQPAYISAAFLFISVFTYMICPRYFVFKRANVKWFLLLFLSAILTVLHANIFGILEVFVNIISLWFVFNLKDLYKTILFRNFRKYLAAFLALSLFFYALYLLGFPLPSSTIYTSGTTDSRSYENYYLFIQLPYLLFDRFSSVFLEPGYLGCLMALLLFAGNYNFRRHGGWFNIVFLICLFATLSLAGWIIAILGFILRSFGRKKNRIIMSSLTITGILALYSFFSTYNHGDNIVNNALIARLQWDSQSNTIAGDNRTSENVTYYFYHQFLSEGNILFGEENINRILYGEDVADWKIYIMSYGIVGFAAFVIFLIFSGIADFREKYTRYCFSLLFFLMFLQTIYGIYWLMYIGTFILGMNEISSVSKYSIRESENSLVKSISHV